MKNPQKTVDEYISNSPAEAQPILQHLREIIKSTIPNVEKSISWNVPYYRYYGDIGGMSISKNHVTFGFRSGMLQDKDRETLKENGYKLGKMTIQIRFDQEVPVSTIEKILRTTADMNERES